MPGPGSVMLRLRSESCLRRKVKVVAENAECFYTGFISAAEQHSLEFVTGWGEVMIKLYSVPSAIQPQYVEIKMEVQMETFP